jgi:hypothetical protein
MKTTYPKDRTEKLMVKAGHAINANDGRCGLIEDALCGTTSICCAHLDLLESHAALAAALERLVDEVRTRRLFVVHDNVEMACITAERALSAAKEVSR